MYLELYDESFKLYRYRRDNDITIYPKDSSQDRTFSSMEFMKYFLTPLKRYDPDYAWLNEISRHTLNQAAIDAENALNKWRFHNQGKPRFRSKKLRNPKFGIRSDSLVRTRNGFTCQHYMKDIRVNHTLPKCDYYKDARISYDGENWWLSISCPRSVKTKKDQGEIVGVDLGLISTAVTSYGASYPNPNRKNKRLKKLYKRKRRLERKLNRLMLHNVDYYEITEKGGRKPVFVKPLSEMRNYQKVVADIRSVYKKITDIRNDYVNKLTRELVSRDKTGVIVVEDLGISNMLKNHHLARSIADQKFSSILYQLSYKSEEEGVHFIKAYRYLPSSKICSSCGSKKDYLDLHQRTYRCDSCGLEIDRDLNAAINLAKYGMNHVPDGHWEFKPVDTLYEAQVGSTSPNEKVIEAGSEFVRIHNGTYDQPIMTT